MSMCRSLRDVTYPLSLHDHLLELLLFDGDLPDVVVVLLGGPELVLKGSLGVGTHGNDLFDLLEVICNVLVARLEHVKLIGLHEELVLLRWRTASEE